VSYPVLGDPACWSWPVLSSGGDWAVIVAWQESRCALCGTTSGRLERDHDHATGLRPLRSPAGPLGGQPGQPEPQVAALLPAAAAAPAAVPNRVARPTLQGLQHP
jgi:hypothetical protein